MRRNTGPGRSAKVSEREAGAKAALDRLMPEVHTELRRLAASLLRRERRDHTLQPTALVNEVYLRLAEQHSVTWTSRTQFFALAAQMMRRVLVNHAEARRAAKRGGGATKITLDPAHSVGDDATVDVLAVDEALQQLSAFAPQQAQIVELRFFGGLTNDEIADLIGKSTPTVEREWRAARAWLYRTLRT
jgi:RNA polymerase sigma factor (TIGR02999 family)